VKCAISTGLGPRARRVVDIKWAETCVGSWRRCCLKRAAVRLAARGDVLAERDCAPGARAKGGGDEQEGPPHAAPHCQRGRKQIKKEFVLFLSASPREVFRGNPAQHGVFSGDSILRATRAWLDLYVPVSATIVGGNRARGRGFAPRAASSESAVGRSARVRGGLLSSLGGVVIRIRILMYCDVSCVYPEGYMYLSCILMYPKCILNALLHSKRIHVS
jgi:hypothetical protein